MQAVWELRSGLFRHFTSGVSDVGYKWSGGWPLWSSWGRIDDDSWNLSQVDLACGVERSQSKLVVATLVRWHTQAKMLSTSYVETLTYSIELTSCFLWFNGLHLSPTGCSFSQPQRKVGGISIWELKVDYKTHKRLTEKSTLCYTPIARPLSPQLSFVLNSGNLAPLPLKWRPLSV